MDELATFTGEFVLETTRARQILETFAGSATPESLGEWWLHQG